VGVFYFFPMLFLSPSTDDDDEWNARMPVGLDCSGWFVIPMQLILMDWMMRT
jgi:hypothetical protein